MPDNNPLYTPGKKKISLEEQMKLESLRSSRRQHDKVNEMRGQLGQAPRPPPVHLRHVDPNRVAGQAPQAVAPPPIAPDLAEEQKDAESQARQAKQQRDHEEATKNYHNILVEKDETIDKQNLLIKELTDKYESRKKDFDFAKWQRDQAQQALEEDRKNNAQRPNREQWAQLMGRAQWAEAELASRDQRVAALENENAAVANQVAEQDGLIKALHGNVDGQNQELTQQLNDALQRNAQLQNELNEINNIVGGCDAGVEKQLAEFGAGLKLENFLEQESALGLNTLQRDDSTSSLERKIAHTPQEMQPRDRQMSLHNELMNTDYDYDMGDAVYDEGQGDVTLTNLDFMGVQDTAQAPVDNYVPQAPPPKVETLSFAPITFVETPPVAAPQAVKKAEAPPKEQLSFSSMVSVGTSPITPPPPKQPEVPAKEHLSFSSTVAVDTAPVSPPPKKRVNIPPKETLSFSSTISVDTPPVAPPPRPAPPLPKKKRNEVDIWNDCKVELVSPPHSPPSPQPIMPFREEMRKRRQYFQPRTPRAQPLDKLLSDRVKSSTDVPAKKPNASRSVQTDPEPLTQKAKEPVAKPVPETTQETGPEVLTLMDVWQSLPWWFKLLMFTVFMVSAYWVGVHSERAMWESANGLTHDYSVSFGMVSESTWLAPMFMWMEEQLEVQTMLLG